MTTQYLTTLTPFSSNLPVRQDADPRRTGRAPFPVRAERGADVYPLPEQPRGEFTSGRQLASDRRTIARCPACAKAVLPGEDYVRDRGDLYHAGCARHRGADDGDGRSL